MRKVCFVCKQEKDLDDFYKHPSPKDGHLGKCKKCCVQYIREYKTGPYRENYLKQRLKIGRNKKERAKKDPKYRKMREAHIAVTSALATGKLIKQPCEVCGTNENIQAHHEDYDKKLDVTWLCMRHHLERHGKYLPGEESCTSMKKQNQA